MDFADHILLTTDFSPASLVAFDAAVVLSKQLGAKITLLHSFDVDSLVPPLSVDPAAYRRQIESELRGTLQAKLDELRRTKLGEVEDVAVRLVEAESLGVDLIIMATHGRTGLSSLLIGSVAEKVVRHAKCPVLVVRGRE